MDVRNPLGAETGKMVNTPIYESGDKREGLHVQIPALIVRTTEDREMELYHNDHRVDATETPIGTSANPTTSPGRASG